MRRLLAAALAACGSGRAAPDAFECRTTISGTVFAPNGTLPLWNVTVFVPGSTPAPLPPGISCARCTLPGDAGPRIATDETGHFTLGVPPGDAIPLVISTGKWRRQLVVPHATPCADTKLDASQTSLPAVRSQGDLPRIAISTGVGDALECLVRKLGISDFEITNDSGDGSVQLYSDRQAPGQGASHFAADFPSGPGFFGDSGALWGDVATLSKYDLVLLSCEGAQYPATKTQRNMNAIQAYANAGGRLYLSHWHDIWIEGPTQRPSQGQQPMQWPQIARFDDLAPALPDGSVDTVDETADHGASFATWLEHVGASPARGAIPLGAGTGRQQCSAVDPALAQVWVRHGATPQTFQFTTPQDKPADARCGKVVYTDMHVSGDSKSDPAVAFPGSCAATELTPQEKALAFMIFDLGSCLGDLL